MNLVARYQADDGALFATEAECLAYEARGAAERIEGLTFDQIAAALDRRDVRLADALKEIGERCRQARLASGGSKRKRREDAGAPLMIGHQQEAAE